MRDLKDTLSLTKIRYGAKATISKDTNTGELVGVVNHPDLLIVMKAANRQELLDRMSEAVAMHCLMSSIDAIFYALNLLRASPNEIKPSVNILIPSAIAA